GGIFESFFGGAGGGRAEERQRGSDLRYDMQITLEEAAFGTEKEIEIRKLDTCDQCNGSGAEAGSRSINCPTCGGRGQVISSRGFFQVSQTCPRCRGAGLIIEKPCRKCGGEGRVENSSRIKLKIRPGVGSGPRSRRFTRTRHRGSANAIELRATAQAGGICQFMRRRKYSAASKLL